MFEVTPQERKVVIEKQKLLKISDNEDHQAQLDAISIALSELQNDNNNFANRRLIEFRQNVGLMSK